MNTEFSNYLRTGSALSEEEIGRINSLSIKRTVRKNEMLLEAGDVCKHKVFVVKGLLRTFSVTNDGNEHIIQFAAENGWSIDAESYDQQTPSRVSIAAVELSEILMWTKEDFEMLRSTIPSLRIFAEKIISQNVYQSRQRILTSISATPEEKYAEFVDTFPDYLARLPLRMIAAYLGISIKTLTRIRHAQLSDKTI